MKVFQRNTAWVLSLSSKEYWEFKKRSKIGEFEFHSVVSEETDGVQNWVKFMYEREFSNREEMVFWRLSNNL